MLSVLIPVYNINCFPLVKSLVNQLNKIDVLYEILCFDDASSAEIETHKQFEKWENVTYTILKKNIGRSRIRNLLALKATYNWLLFLDADTLPTQSDYISTYIEIIQNKPKEMIISGGLSYRKDDLTDTNHLRYVYGKARESITALKRSGNPYKSLLMSNTLVKKAVFDKVQFNEKISQYGHEDSVFSHDLGQAAFPIRHIDNPVFHTGIEPNEVFLKKTKIAIKNLWHLYQQGLIHPEINKLLMYHNRIKFLLSPLFSWLYKSYHQSFEKKLATKNPSLFLFDLYRFSYLCYLSQTEK